MRERRRRSRRRRRRQGATFDSHSVTGVAQVAVILLAGAIHVVVAFIVVVIIILSSTFVVGVVGVVGVVFLRVVVFIVGASIVWLFSCIVPIETISVAFSLSLSLVPLSSSFSFSLSRSLTLIESSSSPWSPSWWRVHGLESHARATRRPPFFPPSDSRQTRGNTSPKRARAPHTHTHAREDGSPGVGARWSEGEDGKRKQLAGWGKEEVVRR